MFKVTKCVFCYVNKETFGKSLRMQTFWLRSPTPDLQGEKRGSRVNHIDGQSFNQPCLCDEAFVNTQKDGVQRASGLVAIWSLGTTGLSSAWKPQCTLPVASGCSQRTSFIINRWSSRYNVSGSVSCSSQLIKTKKGTMGASGLEGQITTWTCDWHLKPKVATGASNL